MTEAEFWSLMDATHPEQGFAAQLRRLTVRLAALPIEQLEAFDEVFKRLQGAAASPRGQG